MSCNTSPFHMPELIRRKRDGGELSHDEIEYLIGSFTQGTVPDYQVAAWLMAVYLRGLSRPETADLTDAMMRSGEVLDLSTIDGKKVDKHSTGGVGDKTSLVLAPLVAAGGLVVPMISGRGLAHTGGTLDKLESIPGFSVHLSLAEFRGVLQRCGCCMISQTAEIAPADRKLYSLRNFTSTVENASLICASIMSKKLAEGIDALVLDVKTGSGAFMKHEEDAIHVADLMVETAKRMGVRATALITDMDQPLGSHVGNTLEVEEALAVLRGGGADDLRALCLELAAWMFCLGGRAPTVQCGKQLAEDLLGSGAALDKFRQMIELQDGDPSIVDDPKRLPQSHSAVDIKASQDGFVVSIDCRHMGIACLALGGGREHMGDSIDHAVGFVLHKKVGDAVAAGEVLCTVHYNSESRLHRARKIVEESYRILPDAPSKHRPLVRGVIRDVQLR